MVDDMPYLQSDNVSKTYIKKTDNKDYVRKNPEDELVAIILSSIIGSIIERWEPLKQPEKVMKPSLTVASEDETVNYSYDDDMLQDNTDVNFDGFKSHNSTIHSKQSKVNRISPLFIKRRTTKNGSLRSHNVSLSHSSQPIEKKINSKSEILKCSSNESNINTVEEEIDEGKTDVVLKSYFDHMKDKIFGWKILENDTEVVVVFKQGNRYEGRLVNCKMHGQGKFYWTDGSTYEGDFCNGEMTGEGRLQWADLSWYEGQMCQGYRHGLGLYVQNEGFYTGSWQCGRRHGPGAMYYSHNLKEQNYYNGEWEGDCKHGTGLRCYPSGAMYSGQWRAGVRHGLGTMVWTNNDVYSGNWENNEIHGYGEYTWETFLNKQLVVPKENCYYGNWERGVRHGSGTLETSLGVTVRGTWENGKKHGAAEVICSNGSLIYSDNLFTRDCISSITDIESDSLVDASMQSLDLHKIPVNAPNHDINLSFYSERLNDFMVERKRTGRTCTGANIKWSTINKSTIDSKTVGSKNSTPTFTTKNYKEEKLEVEFEEILLRNVVLQYLSAIKVIYTKYSKLCCKIKPKFPTVLMRIMFWQLLRDCNLHSKGLSLADYDILIANNKASLVQAVHYPFERLQFWQFLHCIIEISWELYSKRGDGTPTIQGHLAAGLHKLLTSDILPHAGHHKDQVLLNERNMLSLDALYWYYKGLGEPLSARQFLKYIFSPSDKTGPTKHIPDYPEHLLHGENIIGVGGRLTYCPEDEPILYSMKPANADHPQDLTCLSGIGLLSVFQCLLEVCPSIAVNGIVVNIEYKIVFFEFYKLLLLCARSVVNKKEIEDKEGGEQKPIGNIPEEAMLISEQEILDGEKKTTQTEGKSKKSTKTKKKKK